MSSKTKLVFIISFFLIAVLLASLFGYKMLFDKKSREVLATTTEVEEANKENENIENKEVIVVILNENKKETVENAEQNNEEETQEEQNNEQDNQEEHNNEPIIENQDTTNNVEQSTNQVIQNTDSFYIKVNYGANVVTAYTKDLNGNYSVPYKAFTCSTGTSTPTSGTYNIDYKYRWLGLFGNVYGQYCTRIVGNILFHSVPYLEKENPSSLEYWEYDKLRNFRFYGMHKIDSRGC